MSDTKYAAIVGNVGIGLAQFIYVILRPDRATSSGSIRNYDSEDKATTALDIDHPEAILVSYEELTKMMQDRKESNRLAFIAHKNNGGTLINFKGPYKGI